jgi:hypothetical protein
LVYGGLLFGSKVVVLWLLQRVRLSSLLDKRQSNCPFLINNLEALYVFLSKKAKVRNGRVLFCPLLINNIEGLYAFMSKSGKRRGMWGRVELSSAVL